MSAPTLLVPADPSPVRVRRAPPLEPPFDDEPDPTWHPTSGSTARPAPADASPRPADRPADPLARPAPHLPVQPVPHPLTQPGRGPRTQRPMTPRPMRGPDDHPLAARPYATPGAVAAQRFVGVCVEVLNGHRAVSHLRAVTAPGDLRHITDQLIGRTNRSYLGRPGRTAPGPQRVRLVGMRICEPRDGVVEVAAVLAYGIQTWAMAVRMERPAETWLCKLVQVI